MPQWEKLFLTGLLIWCIFIGLVFEPLYEWGQQVAARNDCKTVKCLSDKWYLFEAKCGIPQRTLNEMILQKKMAEYGRATRDCSHPDPIWK